MKITILFIMLCSLLSGVATNSTAQTGQLKKDVFNGAWQMVQVVGKTPNATSALAPVIKVFDEHGNFYNITFMGNSTAVTTMRGKYKILSDSVYTEEITELTPGAMYDLKGKINRLQYKLSKNVVTVKYTMTRKSNNQSDNFEEQWQKVPFYSSSNK